MLFINSVLVTNRRSTWYYAVINLSIRPFVCRNKPKHWDRLGWANSVDPHQTPLYPTSDQHLHCLSPSTHLLECETDMPEQTVQNQIRAATLIWLSGRAGWSEFFLGWLYIFALEAHIIWHDFCFSWLSTQLGVFLHRRPDICYGIISLICEMLSFVTIKLWTW